MFTSSGGYGRGAGVGPGVQLDAERARASFPATALTHYIYGSARIVDRRRHLFAIIERDPVFRRWDNHYLDRPTLYRRGLEKVSAYARLVRDHDVANTDEQYWLRTHIDDMLPIALHHSMFLPTIQNQFNDSQQARWMPLALSYAIIGCYAQSELSHASDVQQLETVAVFDHATDQFVIHTPSLNAMKWWPGNLGLTATHAIVMARLIVPSTDTTHSSQHKSRDYGIHAFLVQLRDLDTHQPLPGVTVGDIGPKFAYDMNDNGYLAFQHVRIPRDNLAMKFVTFDRDGRYQASPNAKLSYATMSFVRTWIIIESSDVLARAITIAIRYSAVRKQFRNEHMREEFILNYQTQQHLLFPVLATTFAYHAIGDFVKQLYHSNLELIQKSDLSLVKEIHVITSGLKPLMTNVTTEMIETCRRALGGHGYHKFSGLCDLYSNYLPSTTYEGENNVLFLQCARELVFVYNGARGVHHGKKNKTNRRTPPKTLTMEIYTNKDYLWQQSKCPISSDSDLLNLQLLLQCYVHRSYRVLATTSHKLNTLIERDGMSFDSAYERIKIDLIKSAKAHCQYLIVNQFVASITSIDSEYAGLRPILSTLCQLYCLSNIQRDLGEFTEDHYLSPVQCQQLHDALETVLLTLRPDVVALVDSFDFSDQYLNSALGVYNGNVYETLYQWSQKGNPMTLDNPVVREGIDNILLPLQKQAREAIQQQPSGISMHSRL